MRLCGGRKAGMLEGNGDFNAIKTCNKLLVVGKACLSTQTTDRMGCDDEGEK